MFLDLYNLPLYIHISDILQFSNHGFFINERENILQYLKYIIHANFEGNRLNSFEVKR
jgi:hypothetical protein